jgi:hypothetical protein
MLKRLEGKIDALFCGLFPMLLSYCNEIKEPEEQLVSMWHLAHMIYIFDGEEMAESFLDKVTDGCRSLMQKAIKAGCTDDELKAIFKKFLESKGALDA